MAVTGAASGIGAATARLAATANYRVAMLDLTAPANDALLRRNNTVFAECDVTSRESLRSALALIEETWGQGPDAVVHCAGIYQTSATEELDLELFARVQHINTTGTFLTAGVLGRSMLERGAGSLVLLSSIAFALGDEAEPGAAYAASKGAVVSMGRQLAAEWGPRGVRTNVVAPGVIDTPMTTIVDNAQAYGDLLATHPMRRLGTAEEVARVCLFLAGPGASFVNGAVIPVDGGQCIV
nr:SDR family NAD(P)-dependent oxidoreductase [Paeniglutamicibacter quisquiliarum]